MPRSSGQKAIPARAMALDGRPISSRPSKRHRTAAVLDDPHDRLQRRCLADAVASEQRHHLAGPHVERDAVQDVRFAIPGFELVDGEQRARARHDRSQISLAHRGIGRYRFVVAVRQDLAAGEHSDAVAQIGDDADIVLNHQHRAVRGNRLDQRTDATDVLVSHARHRFVEQQDRGLERERRCKLQRPLAAIGQLDGQRDRHIAASPTSAISAIARSSSACSTRFERQKSNEPPRRRCSAIRTFSSTVRCGNTAEI